MSEREPRGEEKPSVLEEEDIKKFIERRQIRPEDFYLIETLARFPTDLVIGDLHNMFNVHHGKSPGEIRKILSLAKEGSLHYVKRKTLLETILQFAEKYDWATCYNLVRILEDRAVPWSLEDFQSPE